MTTIKRSIGPVAGVGPVYTFRRSSGGSPAIVKPLHQQPRVKAAMAAATARPVSAQTFIPKKQIQRRKPRSFNPIKV